MESRHFGAQLVSSWGVQAGSPSGESSAFVGCVASSRSVGAASGGASPAAGASGGASPAAAPSTAAVIVIWVFRLMIRVGALSEGNARGRAGLGRQHTPARPRPPGRRTRLVP